MLAPHLTPELFSLGILGASSHSGEVTQYPIAHNFNLAVVHDLLAFSESVFV